MTQEEKIEKEVEGIAKVQEEHEEALLARANVVGVAVGPKMKQERDTGDTSLTVFVSHKITDPSLLKADDKVPETVGKYKTDVIESGEIQALGIGGAGDEGSEGFGGEEETTVFPIGETEVGIELLRQRVRPVQGGYSVGHFRITAGTYATAVVDSRPFPGVPRRYYVLSNNHVLANSNAARIGDPILQPGPIDGGRHPRDTIARLSRWVNIRFGGGRPNLVDAAIAQGPFEILDREIYWVGYVKGVRPPRLREVCQKTGRTTNHSTGMVTALNGTINVGYGGGQSARFIRQIITTNMSSGGDSGSCLCDLRENACGLLFAGSSRITIHNDIRYVQSLLGIRVV